jgi:hypothetical protein
VFPSLVLPSSYFARSRVYSGWPYFVDHNQNRANVMAQDVSATRPLPVVPTDQASLSPVLDQHEVAGDLINLGKEEPSAVRGHG